MAKNTKRKNGAFVVGAVLGAMGGAAAALWKTPYSGEELRAKVTGGDSPAAQTYATTTDTNRADVTSTVSYPSSDSTGIKDKVLGTVENALAPIVGVKLGKTANGSVGVKRTEAGTSPWRDRDGNPIDPKSAWNQSGTAVSRDTQPGSDIKAESDSRWQQSGDYKLNTSDVRATETESATRSTDAPWGAPGTTGGPGTPAAGVVGTPEKSHADMVADRERGVSGSVSTSHRGQSEPVSTSHRGEGVVSDDAYADAPAHDESTGAAPADAEIKGGSDIEADPKAYDRWSNAYSDYNLNTGSSSTDSSSMSSSAPLRDSAPTERIVDDRSSGYSGSVPVNDGETLTVRPSDGESVVRETTSERTGVMPAAQANDRTNVMPTAQGNDRGDVSRLSDQSQDFSKWGAAYGSDSGTPEASGSTRQGEIPATDLPQGTDSAANAQFEPERAVPGTSIDKPGDATDVNNTSGGFGGAVTPVDDTKLNEQIEREGADADTLTTPVDVSRAAQARVSNEQRMHPFPKLGGNE